MAKTLSAGDVIEIAIDSVAFGGAGVGRASGMAVFAPYTLEGERALIEITEVKKRFAVGRLKKLLHASPFRVPPACRYYGICGGCSFQHIAYEHQLEIKARQVREVFQRLGKFEIPDLEPIIPSPRCYNYRIKADYHIKTDGSGKIEAGFMRAKDSRLVDIERCEIVEEDINRQFTALRNNLSSRRAKIWDERTTIWSHQAGETAPDLGTPSLPPGLLLRRVKDRSLLVPQGGFFQVNGDLTGTLVDRVADFCSLKGRETILDGYCGVGLFSLFLSPLAHRITGMEIDGDAVSCAKVNLARAGFSQAAFFRGNMGKLLADRFIGKRKKLDVALLDPPRNGLDKDVLEGIVKTGATRIVYVSCNPATQARDIRLFIDEGFSLKRLQPLDMFPQTSHIEVICLLER